MLEDTSHQDALCEDETLHPLPNIWHFGYHIQEKVPFWASQTHCTGASLWGGSKVSEIPNSTWKEFENVKAHFLTKFLQVKKQMLCTFPLLKTMSLPIQIMAMERVVEYKLKIQKGPSH